jgi:hypothetical protein
MGTAWKTIVSATDEKRTSKSLLPVVLLVAVTLRRPFLASLWSEGVKVRFRKLAIRARALGVGFVH